MSKQASEFQEKVMIFLIGAAQEEELESWSPSIVNVAEKDYADGYLKGGYRKTLITRMFNWVMRTFHMGFMLHTEFSHSKVSKS